MVPNRLREVAPLLLRYFLTYPERVALAKREATATPDDRRAVLLLSSLGGFIGGLCCLAPIVLVLFGLATVSAANSIGNVLYGDYKWTFRAGSAVFLVSGLAVYFRRRGICTLDEARRQRNRLVNVALLAVIATISVYVFWTYVVTHYWGIAVGLPWAQWDERWAIPASAVLFAATAVVFLLSRRR